MRSQKPVLYLRSDGEMLELMYFAKDDATGEPLAVYRPAGKGEVLVCPRNKWEECVPVPDVAEAQPVVSSLTKEEVLKRYFGYDSFREGQETVIESILSGRDTVGVMPTGAGKSLCYQVPAMVLSGVTLVISPLISLMKDQVASLKQAGIPAAYLNSSLTPRQMELALDNAAAGRYKIIYVAPERLNTPRFLQLVQQISVSLVAVDEAHCISQWGQDFRPSYLTIPDFIERIPERPRVCAFTATATKQVIGDIGKLLRLKQEFLCVTGFDRPNLFYRVLHPKSKKAALLEKLRDYPGRSGIVYCSTRKDVEELCDLLNQNGFSATRYHAGLDDTERRQNQDDFAADVKPVMVATNAFGMGIDKSDVRFVIHYSMPGDLESYYQEAGRAGRDGEDAECTLLYGRQDIFTQRYFIEHMGEEAELTPQQLKDVQNAARRRLNAMIDYCETRSCLRAKILNYFGEKAPGRCGTCGSCCETEEAVKSIETAILHAKKRNKTRTDTETAKPDDGLFEALRALRMKLAKVSSVPAYVIFTDATLRAMSASKPKDADELMDIPGVGLSKQKRYGEAFLKEIRKWEEKEKQH